MHVPHLNRRRGGMRDAFREAHQVYRRASGAEAARRTREAPPPDADVETGAVVTADADAPKAGASGNGRAPVNGAAPVPAVSTPARLRAAAARHLRRPPSPRGATSGEPDVFLDVPALHVEELALEVDELQARVALQARVLDLVRLDVGADVSLGRVSLDLKGVDARAQLKVRLEHLEAIVERVMDTIDRNPQLLEQLTRSVANTVERLGADTGRALGALGEGAGQAVGDLGGAVGGTVGAVGGAAAGALAGSAAQHGHEVLHREEPLA